MHRNATWTSAALVLVVATATAHADDMIKPTKPEALQHFKAGAAFYKTAQWQSALDEFTKSALVEIAPGTDYNIAQCHRWLADSATERKAKKEHLTLARYHYRRFLRTTKNTPTFEQKANENIASVEAQLADIERQEQQEAAAQVSATPPPPASATQPTVPAVEPPLVEPRHRRDWFAIGLIATGGLTIAAGGGLYLSATSLRDDANATPDQTKRNDLFAKADTRGLAGALVGGAGVVLVGAGVIKLLVEDDGSSTRTAWRVLPSQDGFVVLGAF